MTEKSFRKKMILTALLGIVCAVQAQEGLQEDSSPKDTAIESASPGQASNFSAPDKEKKALRPVAKDQAQTEKKGRRSLEYSLKINQGDRVLYDNRFSVSNSTRMNLFYGSAQQNAVQMENSILQQDAIIQGEKIQTLNSDKSFELSMMVHVEKNTPNLWSQFFWKEALKENPNNVSMVSANNDSMGRKIEKTPRESLDLREITIPHHNKQQAMFTWQDYTFTLKAVINK